VIHVRGYQHFGGTHFLHSQIRERSIFIFSLFSLFFLSFFLSFSNQWNLKCHTIVNILVPHYNETNVMHFSFSLLRIKGLYMFRSLLADPQEALNKQHLVYCVRIMSVGCATVAVTALGMLRVCLYGSWLCCNRAIANWHTHAIYQVQFVQHLLRMSKWCSKNVEALNSQ
jgi:hypothetical protein